MSETSEIKRTWVGMVRYWPLIVVTVIIGAAIAYAVSAGATVQKGFYSSSKVRVGVTSLPNMPNPAVIVAYAGSADAKSSVVDSMGLDPKGVSITVAADPKETAAINIGVTARDPKTAEAWAGALAQQSREYGLGKIGWMIQLEANKTERLTRRIEYFRQRSAAMSALASSAPTPELRYNYQKAAQDLEMQRMLTEDQLDQSKLTRQGYLSYVLATPATPATRLSGKSEVLSNVLRGAIAGLFIGAIVAALLDRRRQAA